MTDSNSDQARSPGGDESTETAFEAVGEQAEAGESVSAAEDLALLRPLTERLTAERDELRNAYARLAADFDNYRRRTQREAAALVETASEGLIVKLLPVVDNLERALAAALTVSGEAEGGLAAGVAMTLQQFAGVLTGEGVEVIPAAGELFDPTRHEALMQVDEASVPDQTVIEELQKGYTLRGKVVRPSLVKVARSQR